MKLQKIWNLNYKIVLLLYFLISLILSIIEIVLTGIFQFSFFFTYLGLFFIAPFLRKAIGELFKQFHVKKVVRKLITPWILFGIIFLYVQVYFLFYYLENKLYIGLSPVAIFILVFGIITLTLISINHLIRIVAVSFHRRKSDLFPINRIEFPALHYLYQDGQVNFTSLKDRIKGITNMFIPEVYFNDNSSASSIYCLCGIRLANINEDLVVKLTELGKNQYEVWKDVLDNQIKKYATILNSKGVLIRSFIGLFILSLLKILIGTFSSESLRAAGIENFLDCVAIVLIGFGLRFEKEKLVNIILICLMTFAGITIVYESIVSLIVGPEPIEIPAIIIIISITSIFLNTYLRVLKNFVGKKNRNSSLVASAIDSKVNILISVGIILGTLLSEFGRSQGLTIMYYFDPIIAIIISILIFREVIEIFIEFIMGQDEELEFDKFQMSYEENFKEYIIKWILSFYIDNPTKNVTLETLNEIFQNSLIKSEEVYSDFSHFGLYIYKDHGIETVIKELIKEDILKEDEKDRIISLTDKGEYLYENLYSKPILEDIKDPFDFFFEENYDFDSLRRIKQEILEKYLRS